MTIAWVIRAVAAGVLLAAAALLAERAAGWFGLPRRWAWAAAMAATLLLPLLALAAPGLLPAIDAVNPPQAVATVFAAPGPAMDAGAPARAAASLPFGQVFGFAWLVASAAMLAALGMACRRMRAGVHGLPNARLHGVAVRVSERAGPATVGVLAPRIVVPRWVLDAPEAESRLIVWHEREHVAAGDMRLLALAACSVAVMPWNPALWWQYRRMRLAVETDCDARVLAREPGVRSYALALLRAAAAPSPSFPLALAWGGSATHLERRITAMTATRPAHRLPRTLAAAAAACCLLAAACDVTESRLATRASAGPQVVEEGVGKDGRAFRHIDNADGTETVQVGSDPNQPDGYMGLTWGWHFPNGLRPGDPRTEYPTVEEVRPGSPASAAGLVRNDTILSSNGKDGRLGNIFPSRAPGAVYTLRVRRNGVERETTLTVGPERSRGASTLPPLPAGTR